MKKITQRALSLLVCLAVLMSNLPGMIFPVSAAEANTNITVVDKESDPSTIDSWENYFGPEKMDTEFAGGVWTDKSVFTDETNQLPGVTLDNDNNFLVALSAIASNLSITGYSSSPTDTMLVLDVSGSMVDGTYSPGYSRSGNNNYSEVTAIDMSLIEAMVESTNKTIDRLMKQNSNNRVGVVLYSGNTDTDDPAEPGSATVMLPLGRYSGVNGEYLAIDTDETTRTLYKREGGRWQSLGDVTYVVEDTEVHVEVRSGLRTESGQSVPAASKQVIGGTYIQNGLYQAMKQFLNVKKDDIRVPEGRPQAGAERQPVIVLMSDGAPTICTNDYSGTDGTDANIGNSNYGDGRSNQDADVLNRIAVMTQLTAAYVRGRVAAHYQESDNDQKDITFLTLGLGTSADATATATLYPSGSPNSIKNIWTKYLNTSENRDVTLGGTNNDNFDGTVTVRRYDEVEGLNYVDKYFYADDADDLIASFEQIFTEIELKAESYSTLVEGDNPNFSGYVTFEDELGEMMHVADMKGFLMSDGNGGKVLYTGKGLAQGMTNGNLGSVQNPTARGDELIATVRERIPGLDTSMAQRLVDAAYNDQQLYYVNDNNWSNYIGWYADADGNYVGFWDKDSGYENAPANAVYANRSYGYLGVHEDTDMMHVVVQVSTELSTLHQTVRFKIPASLLPTVQYRVTLNEDDPTKVDEFTREDATPMQLVFEVGLRPDINSVNLNAKVAEHLANGGHIHRDGIGVIHSIDEDDPTKPVIFYTNEWAVGNDTNKNGIPDPEEVETAKVAESHFHPAKDNSRYYYTEDTLILDASGNTVGGTTRPTGQYYHHRYIYDENERTDITMPVAESTLLNHAQYDSAKNQWYIPAGTIFSEVARFKTDKTDNVTDTLEYSDYPAVFENVGKQDVYAFLGNNGALTVAPAQGIALTKTVAEVNTDPNAPTEFTFNITLSDAVANPLITDTDGNVLTGISSVNGKVITVTLTAGQTVVISGIPKGTTYSVEEVKTSYYNATSTNNVGEIEEDYTLYAVDFVNTAKHYGNLIVGKDVNYPTGFVPGDKHAEKEFTIKVVFTGDTENMEVIAIDEQKIAVSDNTYTLQLKDGQSVTFAGIPEGVTYTVTEEGMPNNGYTLNADGYRYSDENKQIDGNDVDTVEVVNDYSLQPVSPNVKIRGDKTLVTNDNSWNGETFTVELFRINNFADDEPVSTGLTATMSESNPSYEIDLSSITFDKAGIYYFRAVEQIPEDRNENIAYDRTFGLFTITVGDADADGALEIQDVNAYQTTTVTGNSNDGWTVEKDFTNVVTSDRVYLNIQKQIEGIENPAHLGDITFGLFTDMDPEKAPTYYTLTNTDGEATIMVPVTKEIIDATVGKELVYYMREIAPAVENRVIGMNYDESWIYAISITWDDNTNKAVVKYAPIENGNVGTYVDYDPDAFVFEHTNTYEEVELELDLSGNKTLNGGNDLGGREFSFSLYHSTAAFVKGDKIDTVQNVGNNINFRKISYTNPGVYYMVAEEDPSNLGGITIDSTVYHITVEVEKFTDTDGTTKLRFVNGYPTVIPFGTSDNVGVDNVDFDNTYIVIGSEDVIIKGLKTLDGKPLNANAFQVGLYSDAQCTELIESVPNLANGTFTFSTLTYTPEDLGADYADETFTYYVKEIVPTGAVLNAQTGKYELGGVAYDNTVYVIKVDLSHNGEGDLTAVTTVSIQGGAVLGTAEDNVVQLTINNTYSAKPVDVTLNGRKVLSGDWSAVSQANKTFTFHLLEADPRFNVTNNTPVRTATVIGQDTFAMNLHYEDGQEGIYYFVLEESFVDHANGIYYDAGEYHITVNVSDPGNGQLIALTTMYRPGTGNTNIATFTNRYTVESTSITLEGDKNYTNSVTGQPISQTEGMFTFSVLEGDVEVATGINLADGTIRFTPINYTAAGTHVYNIVEIRGDAGGITYDDAIFSVTVTVTDNGDGTLKAEAEYGEPVEFDNGYNHDAAQVIINGNKQLDGDWSAVSADNKTFLFELYKTNQFYTISGDPVDFVESGEGNFSFGAQTFTTAGKYYFVVREEAAGLNGVDYDDTLYHIEVTVTDDGEGHLIPTVSASDPAVTFEVDDSDNGIITVSGVNFKNEYEAAPAHYTPKAKKIYIGDDMKEFDFVLTVDGNPKQTKQNDLTTGDVIFDELTFDTAGVYTLTVREQKNILFGSIRWDVNVYIITLYVEDNGQGELFVNESKTTITSDKGSNGLMFINIHHSVITEKDVFHVAEPTISIDGETVEKNDILLYKISYKNYDTVPVDIEIQDIIPQYTEYVVGSADKGGVLDGNAIKWSFEDVEPNEIVTVSFKVKVVETDITVINGATVLEGENIYNTNEVTNPVEEDIIVKDVFYTEEPAISINGKKVDKNDILLYKITYTNADDSAAAVTITDTIPQYTEYVDSSADNGGVFAEGKITWNLQLDAGASVTVSFKVKVVGDDNQIIINQATGLDGDNTITTEQITNTIKEDVIVKDVFHVAEPTVSIDNQMVEKNDILLYKVTYTNSDDFDGTVTITDAIPQYTEYVEGSADNNGVFAEGKLTWTFELAAGESKTVSFKVKVVGTKITVENQANAVEGNNSLDSNIVRNPVEEDVVVKEVFAENEPTINIDGKKVEKGDVLIYKITYTNSDGLAADITITDTIPQYTQYVEGSADNDGVFAEGKITWTFELAAGESKTASFKVKVVGDKGQTVTNQVSGIDSDNQIDSNQVTNPIEEDIIVKDVFAENEPTISIDGKQVEKNDILLYKITYTNSEGMAATVTITDAIPQYAEYVDGSADNDGVFADGKITWTLEMGAGETKTVSFKVKVVGAGITVVNQAVALEDGNELTSNQVTNPVTETPPPPPPPQTGDNSNLALWIALLFVSGGAIMTLTICDKKRSVAKR